MPYMSALYALHHYYNYYADAFTFSSTAAKEMCPGGETRMKSSSRV